MPRVKSSVVRPVATPSKNRKITGRILGFSQHSWLVQEDNDQLHRITVTPNVGAIGTFHRGDRIRARVASGGHLLEVERVGSTTSRPFRRTFHDKPRVRLASAAGIVKHLAIEYDGMPITCQENSKHQLVRASAVDRAGRYRQLTIERSWALLSDPTVVLRYQQDGIDTYVARMSIQPDFRVTVAISDDVRTLSYEAAINRGGTGSAFIEINGSVVLRYGAVIESWLSGTYKDGVLDVDISAADYFSDALQRAAYFYPLLKEFPRTNIDQLAVPANQQSLKGSGVSAREFGLIAVTAILGMVTKYGCSFIDVPPIFLGGILCGVVTVSSAVTGVLAVSTYLAPNPPAPPPPQPAPPPAIFTPDPSPTVAPPFPVPDSCPNGCGVGQVCLFGNCVDLTGPTGPWGPGDQ